MQVCIGAAAFLLGLRWEKKAATTKAKKSAWGR